MDDNADASKAIDNVVQALKLAGVEEDVIASHLLASGVLLHLKNGVSVEGVLDEVKNELTVLAKHISDRS
jgi:hypothetical protein